MGKPTKSHFLVLPAEYIGRIEVTGGTETSKYPEEEKLKRDSLVVASERDIGQTVSCASAGGVVGPFIVELQNFVEAE